MTAMFAGILNHTDLSVTHIRAAIGLTQRPGHPDAFVQGTREDLQRGFTRSLHR